MDEGDTVTLTFELDSIGGFPTTVTVQQTSFGGTATQGQDYTGRSSGGVVVWGTESLIFADALTISRSYPITADNTAEPAETITLAVPSVSDNVGSDTYTTTSTAITITIRANSRALVN